MRTNCRLLSGTALAAIAFLAVTPSFAQVVPSAPSDPNGPEVIIVTARKTAENIQNIPVSVTAVTAETIEKLNIQGLTDIARFTPGFSFENYTGPFSAPVIRGQTQTRIDLVVQNTATFFNGVYLQRGYMVDSSLLEVERVEVIKGPQSALYGRNAFSGAINYITARPGDTFKAKASVTVGSDEREDFKASVVLPIAGDTFSTIFAFGSSKFDGTWANSHPGAASGPRRGTNGNLGGYDKSSYLIGAVFKPMENLAFDLAYTSSNIFTEHVAAYTLTTASAGGTPFNSLNCSSLPGVAGQIGLIAGVQNRLYCGTVPVKPVITPGETRGQGLIIDPRAYGQLGTTSVLSAKATWDINDDFAVIYQYGKTKSDVTGRGSPARDAVNGTQSVGLNFGLTTFDSQPNGAFESESNELRVEWTPGGILRRAMIGAYFSKGTDSAAPRAEYLRPNTLDAAVGFFSLGNTSRNDDVKGYFGLASLDLTSSLSVTAELRYTEEKLTLFTKATPAPDLCLLPLPVCPANLLFFYSTPPSINAPVLRRQTDTFDYWTPRVAVDYKLADDHLVYGSVAKGVKSGGQIIPGLDPLQDIYLPEENWTYEIGSKNLFFDKKLRVNVAAFYIDWTGIQGSVARNYPASGRILGVNCFAACAPPLPGTPAAVVIGSLGDATVTGFELDGSWFPTNGLRFDYAFSYIQPEYKDGQFSQRAATSQNCDGIVCATSTFGANGRPTAGPNIGGKTLERTPKLKMSVGAQYDWRMESANIDWTLRGDVTYQDKQFIDELNLAWVPERTLVDASLSATWDKVTARLWVKNLMDEKYVTSAFFLIGTGGNRSASYVPFIGDTRTMGITFSFRH